MTNFPKISICIPVYQGMPNWQSFLSRCLISIKAQNFTDYEIIMTEDGNWSENHNSAIKKSSGQLIKFLHQDDWFTDENSLQRIVDNFNKGWLIAGCSNNPNPYWTEDIWAGNNKLGGPSCLLIENKKPLLFDENLTWMVDCEYYERLYNRYGQPTILTGVNVNIGIHKGQATNLIPNEIKLKEQQLLYEKYKRS